MISPTCSIGRGSTTSASGMRRNTRGCRTCWQTHLSYVPVTLNQGNSVPGSRWRGWIQQCGILREAGPSAVVRRLNWNPIPHEVCLRRHRMVGSSASSPQRQPLLAACGRSGMVVEEGRILISFYSQNDVDEGTEPTPGEVANEIYLAEIEL